MAYKTTKLQKGKSYRVLNLRDPTRMEDGTYQGDEIRRDKWHQTTIAIFKNVDKPEQTFGYPKKDTKIIYEI